MITLLASKTGFEAKGAQSKTFKKSKMGPTKISGEK